MSELKMPQVGASRSEIVANWQSDNPEFWEKFGKKIAKQNLVISTIALTLSFCVCIYGQPLQRNSTAQALISQPINYLP